MLGLDNFEGETIMTTIASCLRRTALAAVLTLSATAALAQTPPHDLLNATLWMQRSVEYKANSLAVFALARLRLDQALADKNWTGAPEEQKGNFQDFPPAIIVDLDETAMDNSRYQAWMVMNDKTFAPPTWTQFVNSDVSEAIPGAVDFLKYADSKGVKVFYVSNRTAEEEAGTRKNVERLGFPMGGNVDVFLMSRKRPDWTSAKSTRRAFIAKDYRVLLNLGDNLGDFSDAYRGTDAERNKAFEDNKERWGREWLMFANPTYGSFETVAFGHDFKKSVDEQRKGKRDQLDAWKGPAN
jgi:5'-nucleotidase (lipoprotein e(P4) family)